MSFSVIIPFYNNQNDIPSAITSVLTQNSQADYEIILIDDGSTDESYKIAQNLASKYKDNIRLYQNPSNQGPGYSRNKAIKMAAKEWIIFLDSDDKINENLFCNLEEKIKQFPSVELISYDFEFINGGGGRKDMLSLKKTKRSLVEDYLSLYMDGSAIFTAFNRKFLIQNNIFFTDFFHEDVYFMFKAYYCANKIEAINKKLYLKNNRENSIVNSISKKHIEGFFAAYDKIYEEIQDQYLQAYTKGIIAICAVKIRDIYRYGADKTNLYDFLYKKIQKFLPRIDPSLLPIETKYFKIFNLFIDSFTNNQIHRFNTELDDLLQKSWSCYDLHHSVFLGSDEIRACCKRFFVNGKKKGDVVLYKIKPEDKAQNIYHKILENKQALFNKINAGIANECNGCPHLEFKKYNDIQPLKFEKISFEYHSICNMKCQYCSEKYYGGKKPIYDIKSLIDISIKNHALKECKSIVWGGGEPTIEKSFDEIITEIASKIDFKQMVITNSLKYSHTLQNLIDNNQAMITTSIDSGYEESFHKIRGVKGISKVFNHLASYASNKPENITIKYILMSENSSKDELDNFIKLITIHQLQNCNFHISCNFNEEKIQKDLICSSIILYAMLRNIGVNVVFFDELLRERIFIGSEEELKDIKKELQKFDLDFIIESPQKYQKICIWGSIQAKLLLSKTLFFSQISSVEIIDSNPLAIGKTAMNKTIKSPMEFLNDDSHIVIAAVQGTPRIYREFLKAGFDPKRLIRGVIL